MSEAQTKAEARAPTPLDDVLGHIRGLTAASRGLAHRIGRESAAKEDLLTTLSAVEIALLRLEIEAGM